MLLSSLESSSFSHLDTVFFAHKNERDCLRVDGAEQSLPLEEIILFYFHSLKQLMHPRLKLIGWDKL